MRLIHATVDPEASESLEHTLEEVSATYSQLPVEDAKGRELWVIAVGMDEVESLLEALRENRDSEEDFAVVSEAEAILSKAYEDYQEELEEEGESRDESISRDELVTRAEDLSRGTTNYIIFTIISGIVATVGLLTNSAAIVVGSMVIAPLIGPAMASSVATVVNDNEMFWEGVETQAVGITVAIISACLFALLVRFTILPQVDLLLLDQVVERVHPGPLALIVALGAGVAGSLSLTSGVSTALVGVMIAVALIPPAATLGLGLAYWKPVVAVSSGVLVLLNLFSINLAGIGTLWFKGYRPESWFESRDAKQSALKRSIFLGGILLMLTGALAFGTYQERVNAKLHQSAVSHLQEKNVEVLNLTMDYKFYWWYRSPYRITVRVANPSKDLADQLRKRIRKDWGRDLEVRLVEESIEVSGAAD